MARKLCTVNMQAGDSIDNLDKSVTGRGYRGAVIVHPNPTWVGRSSGWAIFNQGGEALAVADTSREADEWVTARLASGLGLVRSASRLAPE